MTYKIVITGGRDFDDEFYLRMALAEIDLRLPIVQLTHGNARGADKNSGQWAIDHDIKVVVFHADWAGKGNAAGPIRNKKMIDTQPDFVVAFPGGKGTNGCVKLAENAGVPVIDLRSKPSVERIRIQIDGHIRRTGIDLLN